MSAGVGGLVGVIAMAYGTPRGPGEVAAYYTHILGGRTPPAELVENLQARYDAIGGYSPLRAHTEAQRDRLASELGRDYLVSVGYKHAAPFIEDAVAEAVDRGARRLVGVVLAPHYSRVSVGDYLERLRTAAATLDVSAAAIESWHDLPEWLEFQATAVRDGLAALPAGADAGTKVLFSAHSLPEQALAGDVYADQLHESASAIARRAGLDRWAGWSLCWQSAGRSGGPWRGPDVLQLLDDLAATGRARGVLVCPQGFTCEHLEVLYDLDTAARRHAEKLGLVLARTRMVNDDATVFRALARRIANR